MQGLAHGKARLIIVLDFGANMASWLGVQALACPLLLPVATDKLKLELQTRTDTELPPYQKTAPRRRRHRIVTKKIFDWFEHNRQCFVFLYYVEEFDLLVIDCDLCE